MNKRFLVILAVLVIAAGMGFTKGQSENPVPGELNTYTGTVHFEDDYEVVLKTDQGEYELMFPRFLIDEIDVAEGQRITVEGYEMSGPRMMRWESDEQHLMVTKATINGKEYDLGEQYGYGHCIDGDYGPGMHGGGRGGWGRTGSNGGWMGRPRSGGSVNPRWSS